MLKKLFLLSFLIYFLQTNAQDSTAKIRVQADDAHTTQIIYTFPPENLPLIKEVDWFYCHIDTLPDAYTNNYGQSYNLKPICGFIREDVFKYKYLSESEYTTKQRNWLIRKLKYESLIRVQVDSNVKVNNNTGKIVPQFHLSIDPLFNLQYGKDKEDKTGEKLYTNTRGVLVRGCIGSSFTFESSFLENQSTLPKYLDAFADTFKVIPGQGRWKKFKDNGYDYAMSSGHISYSPNKHFNFQLGHGKHFVGDGYRSLLLSDVAFNYPYARITANFKKIQYTQLYAIFMNLKGGATPLGTETLFQKKAGSFQMLSWNISKRIQLGFFQGLIWEAADSKNNQHLNLNYFNPVIFGNAVAYSLHNKNNVLLGSTVKFHPFKNIFIYGQYVLDDIAKDFIKGSLSNKQGFQLGARVMKLFSVPNLNFLVEYNQVRPYTYSHENAEQSYTHYNQSLAHPLGANFKEVVSTLAYRWKDFFTEGKIVIANIGADSINTSLGNNIFKSDNMAYYGIASTINNQNQGVKAQLYYAEFKVGYIVNPVTNMNISAGIILRNYKFDVTTSKTNIFYLSFRTSLSNIYYDF